MHTGDKHTCKSYKFSLYRGFITFGHIFINIFGLWPEVQRVTPRGQSHKQTNILTQKHTNTQMNIATHRRIPQTYGTKKKAYAMVFISKEVMIAWPPDLFHCGGGGKWASRPKLRISTQTKKFLLNKLFVFKYWSASAPINGLQTNKPIIF